MVCAVIGTAHTTPALANPISGGVTPGITPPSRAGGSYSARLVAPVRVTSRPGRGRVVARLGTATTWSHSPQSLLILRSREIEGREWLKVLLPVRPTGSKGWIPRSRVVVRFHDLWVEVRKKNRWLVAFRDGRRIRRFRIVIGTRSTPTPVGLAAIYERNRQPDPDEFLGPWSLPLTALSPTLKNYGGGPGRIALHGRGGDSYLDPLGSAASHGCIRVPNRGIRWLARHAGPGTPVRILRG
ncbi:MAG: L,D-transpeptidase [Solirubrobacterales bacterium]|nr:L,D-transpeptidase [Solirubrobacterales bacterium]